MPRRFEGQRLKPLVRVDKEVYKTTAILGPASTDRKTRTFRGTKAACQVEADAWYAGLIAPPEEDLRGKREQPLSLYLAGWLESKGGALKDNTHARYKTIIEGSIIPTLGSVPLCDLSSQHIRDYIAACKTETCKRTETGKLSSKTIRNRIGVLSSALTDAMYEQPPLITLDPIAPLRGRGRRKGALPRVNKSLTYIMGPREAAKAMRAVEGSYIETLAYVALDSGARLGELLSLRWRDVDFDSGVITISRNLVEAKTSGDDWYTFDTPKSGHGRSVEVSSDTVARLKAHKKAQAEVQVRMGKAWKSLGLVFPNTWQRRTVRPGTPLRPSTVSRTFRSLADAAGLQGMRFHDLRHACATIALQTGKPAHVVQQRLGHSDVALTLRVYAAALPGQQKELAEESSAAVLRELAAL